MLKAIVGELPGGDLDVDIAERADGSWLVDGGVSVQRLKSLIGISGELPGEADNAYHTVGGFVLFYLEDIPRVAETFEYREWRFEIVDIDGVRIDKVLITPRPGEE
ncbi:transporter associated domain-containing protein [Methylomonas koyamae]|uniref:transporter associated domain-containing protein n=1 Tax=Methylomonas koyamae TaxID=702114 RepID=UPI00210F81C3|nr:transporter associated domain-containing protein [Methylomonas koyamae]